MSETTDRLATPGVRRGRDEPLSSPKIDAAEMVALHARQQYRHATRDLYLRRARLLAARVGVPWWVTALIAGTLLVAVLAALAIFTFRLGPVAILFCIVLGYGVGAATIYHLFRDTPGESDASRVAVRVKHLDEASARRRKTRAVLVQATDALAEVIKNERELERIVTSDSYRRKLELERLSAVDREHLTADEFTQHVAGIFRFLGFHVDRFGGTADTGVSMIVYKEKIRIAWQVKHHLGAVDTTAVQEVVTGMTRYQCHRCGIITLTTFTPSAVNLAASTGCLLIGAEQFQTLIRGEILL